MKFTLSGQVLPHPADAADSACPPCRPSVPTRRRRRSLRAKLRSWITMVLMVSLTPGSRRAPRPRSSATGPVRHRGVTLAMLRTWSVRFPASTFTLVRSGPSTRRRPRAPRPGPQLSFGADLLGHASDFRGEAAQLIDLVLMVFLRGPSTSRARRHDLLREVAVGHRGGDLAMLRTWSVRFPARMFTLIGQVLPGPRDASRRPGRPACRRCRLLGAAGHLPANERS